MAIPAKQEFFIGANTGRGFVCYAEDTFRDLRKLYLIKGGPGTGKSTLMKQVAAAAEEKGITVEYYRCSSDPDSLDGIVLRDMSVGFVDATAPHVMESRYPGAREEILDLGIFWNAAMLEERFHEIKALSDEKAETFASVYQYMSVASSLRRERNRLLRSCTIEDKLRKAIARMMKNFEGGENVTPHIRQIGSVGMKGVTMLPTYETMAESRWQISDVRGLRSAVFEEILQQALQKGCAVWISRDYTGEVEALYFPDVALAITCGGDAEGADRILNTDRFVCRERLTAQRARLRFLMRMESETMERVAELFSEIKQRHFALEQIYGEAMDYDGLGRLTQDLITKLAF